MSVMFRIFSGPALTSNKISKKNNSRTKTHFYLLRWNSWTFMTKDSSLLLRAIHSLSTGGYLKKTRLYSGYKSIFKNIPDTRKLESIYRQHFGERKNEGRNQTKTRV